MHVYMYVQVHAHVTAHVYAGMYRRGERGERRENDRRERLQYVQVRMRTCMCMYVHKCDISPWKIGKSPYVHKRMPLPIYGYPMFKYVLHACSSTFEASCWYA